ncbi:MAG: hypothetical protein AABX83_01435 [Nanoarchaeota archaeon]
MNNLDEVEEVENFIVLLLGSDGHNVSEIFLQKELFILSNIDESLKLVFNFKKHYKGPYSDVVSSSLDSPLYLEDSFKLINNQILLTEKGKKDFIKLSKDEKYKEIIPLLKFLRKIYERLSYEELLFLIYSTYPEYTEMSDIQEEIFKRDTKKRILNNLLRKGLITEERYEELK